MRFANYFISFRRCVIHKDALVFYKLFISKKIFTVIFNDMA